MPRRHGRCLRALSLGIVASGLLACGGDEGGGGRLDDFRRNMASYDTRVDDVLRRLVALADATQAMKAPLARGDMKAVDAALDRQVAAVDGLLAALGSLEKLEYLLRDGAVPKGGLITRPLLVLGVLAVIAGTYAFAKKMKQYSDEMSRHRKERDAAMARVAKGDPKAVDDVAAAKKKMVTTGGKAITELTTKVSSELVTAPIKTATAGGVILKEAAGHLYAKGVKVLTASAPCAKDARGASCRIGVQRTDANGRVPVPAGEQTLLISRPGSARIAVTRVKVTAGKDTEVVRPFVPVGDATPENTADNDAGRYTPPSKPPPGRGPKCTKLAACCLKINNSAYLRQQCDATVKKNTELHCSILLLNVHIPYGCQT